MKNRLTMSVLLACLVWLLHLLVASAQTGITISNADAQWKSGLTTSSELAGVLTNVTARVATQYGDAMQRYALSQPDDTLHSQLTQAIARIIFTYSDAGRVTTLRYPQGLLNDVTPPKVANPQSAFNQSEKIATIRWTTDEFAKSILQYGTQSGVYLQQVADPLYVKEHSLTLNGLTVATTYYYVITSTDRDGNSATAAEASFVSQVIPVSYPLYLPLVRR